MSKCIGFQPEDIEEAFEHIDYEVLRNYGDYAFGHWPYALDDGERLLVKCKNCGGYSPIQKSEYHSFTGDDSYYTDYFPVDSEQEADDLNKMYDGFEIAKKFNDRYMVDFESGSIWMGK